MTDERMAIDSDEQATPAGFGPGKTLRQARVDLKLTPEEVAQLLHLAPRQITALENDDYEELPQATYVKGYLRNYALLLGLSPDPILEAYARMNTGSKPSPVVVRTEEPTSRDGQVRLVTYIIGAVIIGFAIAWWRGYDTKFLERPAETPVDQNVDRSTPVIVAPAPAEHAEERAPAATRSVPAPAPASVVTAPTAPTTPVPEKASEPPQQPAPVVAPVTDAAQASLVLRTEQESWAEVRDAEDNKLIYQLLAPGRVIRVVGPPPFSVFVGNADGVQVEYNGKAYDFSRFKRGEVARFTLGKPQATR